MSVGLTELTPGVGSTEPGKSAAVGFADGGAGIGTVVTLSSPRLAGRLTFNAGSKTYTL